MSDITDVNITGIGDLDSWATESTAAKIEAHLSKLLQLSKADQLKMKKMLAEMASDRKLSKRTMEEAARAARHGKATGKSPSGTATPKSKTGNLFDSKGLTSGLGSFADSVLNSNKHLKTLSDELRLSGVSLKNFRKGLGLAVIGGIFSLLGKVIGKAITNVEQTTETMTQLYESGVRFNGGIIELQRSLAQTGMTLEQVSKIGEQYATIMMTKGMTGMRSILAGTDQAIGGLEKFALTTADAAEYAAEYLETQRLAGVLTAFTEKQQSKMLAENIQRLTEYSKALGVSRKEMLAAGKDMLTSADVQRRLANMSEEERKKAMEGFSNMGQVFKGLGPGFNSIAAMFQDVASYGNNMEAASRTAMDLMSAGYSEVFFEIQKIKQEAERGIIHSAEEVQARLTRALPPGTTMEMLAMNQASREITNTLGDMKGAGIKYLEAQKARAEQEEKDIAAFAKSVGLEHDMDAARKEYLRRQQSNIEAMKKLDDSMNKLKASWNFILTKGFLDILGGLFSKLLNKPLSEVMGDIAGGIADFSKWIQEIADNGIFQKIGEGVGTLINKFIEWANNPSSLFKDIIDALGAGFKMVADAIANWSPNLNPFKDRRSEEQKLIEHYDKAYKHRLEMKEEGKGFLETEQQYQERLENNARVLERLQGEIAAARAKAGANPLAQTKPQSGIATGTVPAVNTATPVTKQVPPVQKDDAEAQKKKAEEAKKDSIADILKTGTNDQLGMLDDIRQLMAMSARSLDTIAKRTTAGGALLQG